MKEYEMRRHSRSKDLAEGSAPLRPISYSSTVYSAPARDSFWNQQRAYRQGKGKEKSNVLLVPTLSVRLSSHDCGKLALI